MALAFDWVVQTCLCLGLIQCLLNSLKGVSNMKSLSQQTMSLEQFARLCFPSLDNEFSRLMNGTSESEHRGDTRDLTAESRSAQTAADRRLRVVA